MLRYGFPQRSGGISGRQDSQLYLVLKGRFTCQASFLVTLRISQEILLCPLWGPRYRTSTLLIFDEVVVRVECILIVIMD